jgi:NAD(P)-dependent dehydrogenase (short-subunit alcohol dehydrogenase family)
MGREPQLDGQTVLVIGGSSGIGLETARRAHGEGASLIITARDPERVHRAGLELAAGIAAFDATDFDRLERFFAAVPTQIDHVLVTVPGPHRVPLAQFDVDDARRELDAHLVLPLRVAREAATKVRPGGTLLFTGCTDRGYTEAGSAFVSALTATLSAMTRSLAYELAPIRVNLIAFGLVDTPLAAAILGDRIDARREELRTTLPIRRVIDAGDIAALAVHLMTNTAVTGATLDIDGGQQLIEGPRSRTASTQQGGDQGVTQARGRLDESHATIGTELARRIRRGRRPQMSDEAAKGTIRPFRIDVPQEALDDLRRRIASTRWPSNELVDDRSQGVQLATMRELARYWTTEHDWRMTEAKLNALPQFTTEIDGADIHFIHVRSKHEDALPLIMTHGWPGSVIELLETVEPLTDPTAHGGRDEDAFHLVLPSVPGYGFSAEPTELGWYAGRVAQAWPELMRRLGYARYVAQGGDVGAAITDAMGRQAAQGLNGIHTNLFVPALGGTMPTDTEQERAAVDQISVFRATGFGYFLEQATRPQTIGYALLDSPVALAAWMLDHDTDSYLKISDAFVHKQPSGNLTRDHVLDNITLYWLTGTGASAARSYWESGQAQAKAAGQAPPPMTLPFGFTTFPGEIWRTPRSWVDKAYPNVVYFNEADRGGHFAAWEEPQLFSEELRAAFRSLR